MRNPHALTQREWEAIRHLAHGKEGDPGRTAACNRTFVDAVLWVLRGERCWHELPPCYGPYKSVHKRYRRWVERGVWARIVARLNHDLDTGLPAQGAAAAAQRATPAESIFDLA